MTDDNFFETNWNVTFQVGRTALLTEVTKDYRTFSSDLNNMSDWGFNLQIAKMVWERFDLGFEFGVSNYKGFKNNPSNVPYLMAHFLYNNENKNFKPYPIYYDSDFTNFSIFLKYNFINFSSWTQGYFKMNVYAKLGFGFAFPSAEMGYTDMASYELTGLEHPLYLKGRYPNPKKDTHSFFSPAFGLNYQLSERIFLSGEASFQQIGADNLDGVKNYERTLTIDTPYEEVQLHRRRVNSITAKFMVGATYFFNFDTRRLERERNMPWFKSQYRSYYSHFHRPSSKKRQQQRQPFFNKNFEEE